ncbi:MAG: hypothetical protein IPP96_13200 [Chitinophagaceae bacterium]|nr:hypothetical protein [Chitinophagaceae bacterium]
MKKQHTISAILFSLGIISTAVVSAQDRGIVSPVEKGSITFNAGVGTGTEYKSDYYNSALGTKASIEAGLWNAGPGVITLGVEAGTSFSNGGYYDNYKTSTLIVAGRSAWHHGWNVRNLDTYAGLSAGVGFHQYRYNKNGEVKQNEVIPVFGGFVGASYFITPRFGVNIEAGYDITQIQGGIIFKLK